MSQEIWKPLRPRGLSAQTDKIAAIALSDHAKARTVKGNLKRFANQCGVNYLVGKYVGESVHDFAATDEQKSADLEMVMSDSQVKVVFCATGGYSIARYLRSNEELVFRLFSENPKLWMGFSDACVLSMFLLANLNLVSASSRNVWGFESDWNDLSAKRAQEFCFGQTNSLYASDSWKPIREGEAEGVVIAANLGSLSKALGTVADPLIGLAERNIPVILVVETFSTTLDEVAAELDHIFHQRRQANISALVLGGRSPGMFAGPYLKFYKNNSLLEVVERGLPKNIPWGVYSGFGHSEVGNHAGYKPKHLANRFMETIPIGVWGKTKLGSECQLTYDCPVEV